MKKGKQNVNQPDKKVQADFAPRKEYSRDLPDARKRHRYKMLPDGMTYTSQSAVEFIMLISETTFWRMRHGH